MFYCRQLLFFVVGWMRAEAGEALRNAAICWRRSFNVSTVPPRPHSTAKMMHLRARILLVSMSKRWVLLRYYCNCFDIIIEQQLWAHFCLHRCLSPCYLSTVLHVSAVQEVRGKTMLSCVTVRAVVNTSRDFTKCHGVSLEGGLVPERVAAAIYQFSPVDRADNPNWRGF